MRLEGELDRVALEKSLNELLRRHEILRTSFPMVDGQPIQDIAAPSPVYLPCHDLQSLSPEEQTTKFQEIAIATATESRLLDFQQNLTFVCSSLRRSQKLISEFFELLSIFFLDSLY